MVTMALALLLAGGAAFAATFTGTDGDDTLESTARADTLRGLGGNDTFRGLGGPDRLVGGAGVDLMEGDGAADNMYGGEGEDRMVGVAGRDHVYGGPGDDLVSTIDDNAVDFVDCGAGYDEYDRSLTAAGPDVDDVYVNCELMIW